MLNTSFPVAEAVSNCYLVDMIYKPVPEGVEFVFRRNSNLLRYELILPRKKSFHNGYGYESEFMRVTTNMESILFTYLTAAQMLDCRRSIDSDKGSKFKQYITNLKERLVEVDAFNTPITLKTIKVGKNITLPKYINYNGKYVPFIKRSDDPITKLKYTTFERKTFRN